MTLQRRLGAFVTAAALLLGTTAISGCVIVPVKMKTRVEGPAGTKGTLPKDALVPGVTTRQEVEQRYRGLAVDTGLANLFWARFRKSSWGLFAAVGAQGAGAAGWGRLWNRENLLIGFNSDGTVKNMVRVGDEQFRYEFAWQLFETSAPPLDLSQPIPIAGLSGALYHGGGIDSGPRRRRGATDLEVTGDSLVVTTYTYRCPKKRCHADEEVEEPHAVTLGVSDIETVTFGDGDDQSTWLDLVLRFKTKTAIGDSLRLPIRPFDAPLIIRWWRQVRPDPVAGVTR